eukprot:6476988-Amphidinium_carterae.1
MVKINKRTTFDEVHQWISNYFNSTYTGRNEDNRGTIGGVSWGYDNDDKNTIACMKGKAKGLRKGKGKGKKRDNGKGKYGKTTVACYTCGKHTHRRLAIAIHKASMGKDKAKAVHNNQTVNNKGKATAKAMENNGTVVTTKVERQDKFQFNKSTTNYPYFHYEEDPSAWDYSYNQEWYPEADYPQQLPGQEVNQNDQLTPVFIQHQRQWLTRQLQANSQAYR